jgi:hypothetical protein
VFLTTCLYTYHFLTFLPSSRCITFPRHPRRVQNLPRHPRYVCQLIDWCLLDSRGSNNVWKHPTRVHVRVFSSFRQLRPSFVHAPPLPLSPLYSPHGISARESGYPPTPSSSISTALVLPPQAACLSLSNTTHGPPRKHSLTRFQLQITSEERHCDSASSRRYLGRRLQSPLTRKHTQYRSRVATVSIQVSTQTWSSAERSFPASSAAYN